MHIYRNFFKRIIDLVISFFIFLILSPLFIIITFVLCIVNKGKPFFIQKRPGKDEKLFKIIKFKTMSDATDENGNLLSDDKRLTGFGKFVRKTSLDEIPQLLNVIKGDMSLIGPRPLLPEYLPLYNIIQKRRHEANPGITGWAQVNGRNAISWKMKFEFDVWYIDNISFLLDIKILFLTLKKVIIKEGINSGKSVTMEYFTGNN